MVRHRYQPIDQNIADTESERGILRFTAAPPNRLRRLLHLHAKLDYLPAHLRRNPRHFSLKAVWDVKLDYLCHEMPLLLSVLKSALNCPDLQPNCRTTREQVCSPLCSALHPVTAWKDRSRLASKCSSPIYSAFDSGNRDSLPGRL